MTPLVDRVVNQNDQRHGQSNQLAKKLTSLNNEVTKQSVYAVYAK